MYSTYFFLKPDGFQEKEKIIQDLEYKIEIEIMNEFFMNKALCKNIYAPFVDEQTIEALIEYLKEDLCLAVKCYSTVENILNLSGLHTMPSMCDSNSIRYKYGLGSCITKSGYVVIKNAIHRPKNRIQSEEQMVIMKNFGIII